MKKPKTFWYNVYLNGKKIDMVAFTGYDVTEAKQSLIHRDGHDAGIVVVRGSKVHKTS